MHSVHVLFKKASSIHLTKVPIMKIWKFDSAKQPWDPEKLNNQNVGIPVSYRIVNNTKSGLGKFSLWGGKARLFQDDGHESTIFLGEDRTGLVPVGEKMELYMGDSRDIVVTQRKMQDARVVTHKNSRGDAVLYDTNEQITAKIENFKDSEAVLTMVQHIPGQWDMQSCNMEYKKKDAYTLEFEIRLPARTEDGPAVKELKMYYHRRNIRPGAEPRPPMRR